MPAHYTRAQRAIAEAIGTLFLVASVVGSGIMAQRLSIGNDALALLANAIATGAALVALILAVGPISGAHFNPVVTFAALLDGASSSPDAICYAAAQLAGGVSGTIAAHLMFGLPLISLSRRSRGGPAQMFSEFVATFGLIFVISACSRFGVQATAIAVASYITAAYWFTASTSFANPAVTIGRTLTDTFSGIRAGDAPGFILSQFAGGTAAAFVFRWLTPPVQNSEGTGVFEIAVNDVNGS